MDMTNKHRLNRIARQTNSCGCVNATMVGIPYEGHSMGVKKKQKEKKAFHNAKCEYLEHTS